MLFTLEDLAANNLTGSQARNTVQEINGIKELEVVAIFNQRRASDNSIIYDVKINRKKDYLYITFVGKSFYRYMVRNMVGALMLVGTGKEDPSIIKTLLENKDKNANYMTVPANGLYLEKVEY